MVRNRGGQGSEMTRYSSSIFHTTSFYRQIHSILQCRTRDFQKGHISEIAEPTQDPKAKMAEEEPKKLSKGQKKKQKISKRKAEKKKDAKEDEDEQFFSADDQEKKSVLQSALVTTQSLFIAINVIKVVLLLESTMKVRTFVLYVWA